MDVVQGLLKIAKEKKLHIMSLFLTAGIIVFIHKYKIEPISDLLYVEEIPDSVFWIFPTVFIFSGVLLLLNIVTQFKHIFGFINIYIPHHGASILKLFSKTGHSAISGNEITNILGLSVHKFEYTADILIKRGYLETDDDEFSYDGPKYWLTQKGRKFLANRFLL